MGGEREREKKCLLMIPPMQVVVGHSKLLVLQQTLGMLLLLALKKKAFFGLCVEEREREREFVKKKVDFHPPPPYFCSGSYSVNTIFSYHYCSTDLSASRLNKDKGVVSLSETSCAGSGDPHYLVFLCRELKMLFNGVLM